MPITPITLQRGPSRRNQRARSRLLSLLPLALAGALARGGDGIALNVTNDGTVDIFVTIVDSNTKLPIIEHQRVNGFSSIPISASADASGRANIAWTAISVDTRDPHCGRGTASSMSAENAVVNVHADSSCPGR